MDRFITDTATDAGVPDSEIAGIIESSIPIETVQEYLERQFPGDDQAVSNFFENLVFQEVENLVSELDQKDKEKALKEISELKLNLAIAQFYVKSSTLIPIKNKLPNTQMSELASVSQNINSLIKRTLPLIINNDSTLNNIIWVMDNQLRS